MREFDFYGRRKLFFTISIALIVFALIFGLVFGVKLDIQFKGGAILTYSYTGDINKDAFKADVEAVLGEQVSIQETTDVTTGSKSFVVNMAAEKGIPAEKQLELTKTLEEKYAANEINTVSINVVDPIIGKEFLYKCLVAVLFASLLMVLYISVRFRLVGGWSAGVTAVIALLHDVLIVFSVFIIFGIPLNDNFIAVVLTILGYSLNDTIVIFDRVRENKRLYGNKLSGAELMNKSLNQSLVRTIYTTLTTVSTMIIVSIIAYIYNVNSILSFSFPMILGMISGVYSSLCIASPLFVVWEDKKKHHGAA